MSARRECPALDHFRVLAAVLVVCIHTSPLGSFTQAGDFWLTRVLARVAVPFFLMVSGYFLARDCGGGFARFLKKALLTYGAAVLLYLPLNWYNGGYAPLEWVKKLLLDGTLYHLWYFPAVILGVLIARCLAKLSPAAWTIAGLLYLIGLGGDSYYGLISKFPVLPSLYGGIFTLFDYTRNGLFFAPLFLLLGAEGAQWNWRVSIAGFLLSLAGMSAEGFLLRGLEWQRHDSMYLFLPLCMVFLFSLLLSANCGQDKRARRLSMLVYLLHPWCIVLVRFGAKAVGLMWLLVDNSLVHTCAVLALSFCAAFVLNLLRPSRILPKKQ